MFVAMKILFGKRFYFIVAITCFTLMYNKSCLFIAFLVSTKEYLITLPVDQSFDMQSLMDYIVCLPPIRNLQF